MSQIDDALAASRVLDDGEGTLEARLGAQGRVHAALSAPGAVPSERPASDIRARVMMRIGAGRGRAGAWRAVGPVALAASLTLLAAVGWKFSRVPRPVSPPQAPVDISADTPNPASQFAVLLKPLDTSGAAVRARVEAPFLREAELIRQDTRQGVEMVLAHLPLGSK
jgi:hypothetical protein